ncbi:4-aminobutyrate--2-oxoglutarate transaminase [Novosphingobium taihuense]|uniref:4-aminobutyrate aminotransferase/(S)-3-amino-2-methylpropionate transaminase n=1 Tax=Novosphingobium taihuense TaxID=260085 RepID=A0A7W7ABX3_9SPHN|nr:4-aminobutyrate--2-oxoglutarate transaminase [Novosphingobium taihuense]MBB4614198.1 4-aminobutyrate aminotransferase/(S)-3-amino-2-methylpropionate transaminase [Novosphingobium taihuense]TWH87047.1 4-aminobutyrate aminotransferase/(S)-3-amino-2-methylpropionate transaminase [Novosphingobium taihuense]
MKNQTLLTRRANAVPRGVSTATPVFAARAENAEIWDVEGKRYVDFAGGIAVLNVGHRHPRVVAAVEQQLRAYTHTAFQVMAYEPYIELAERLNAIAPVEGDAKTIFFTTGAEATENAVKIARAATGRPGIIAFAGGFHGRTLLSSAMTGKVNPYKRGLGPFPAEIYHVPLPSPTNGVTLDETLRALDFLFAADIEPERIAAFIIEPVQGEGGFHMPDPELYQALARLREQWGMMIIADEVQSGFARTGRMFGIEHQPVKPDLVTVAKSLAGGFPLAGVIGRAEVMDAIGPGGLGGTYAGSPIAVAAALAVLDVIEDEQLNDRANQIGARIRTAVEAAAARNDTVDITGLRGPGAMVAFDVPDPVGVADGTTAKRVASAALDRGLVLLTCGTRGQTIRILVPLTASDDIIDEGLAIMADALACVTEAA